MLSLRRYRMGLRGARGLALERPSECVSLWGAWIAMSDVQRTGGW